MERKMTRKIVVFPYYSANGVWDWDGIHLSLDELDISNSIKKELILLQTLYDSHDKSYNDEEPDVKINYAKLSFNIALKIKKEQPFWEVYFLNIDGYVDIQRESEVSNRIEVLITDNYF